MRVLWALGVLFGAAIAALAALAAVGLLRGNDGAWVTLAVGTVGLVFFGIGWAREAPLFGRRTARDRTTSKAGE